MLPGTPCRSISRPGVSKSTSYMTPCHFLSVWTHLTLTSMSKCSCPFTTLNTNGVPNFYPTNGHKMVSNSGPNLHFSDYEWSRESLYICLFIRLVSSVKCLLVYMLFSCGFCLILVVCSTALCIVANDPFSVLCVAMICFLFGGLLFTLWHF